MDNTTSPVWIGALALVLADLEAASTVNDYTCRCMSAHYCDCDTGSDDYVDDRYDDSCATIVLTQLQERHRRAANLLGMPEHIAALWEAMEGSLSVIRDRMSLTEWVQVGHGTPPDTLRPYLDAEADHLDALAHGRMDALAHGRMDAQDFADILRSGLRAHRDAQERGTDRRRAQIRLRPSPDKAITITDSGVLSIPPQHSRAADILAQPLVTEREPLADRLARLYRDSFGF